MALKFRAKPSNGHKDGIRSLLISNDGTRLYTGSYDCTVRIWDVQSGEVLEVLESHKDWVCALAMSHDHSTLYSASADNTIKVWGINKKVGTTPLTGSFTCKEWHIPCLTLAPDDSMLVYGGAVDNEVKMLSLPSGEEHGSAKGHTDWVSAVHIAPNGSVLFTGGFDHSVRVWTCPSMDPLAVWIGHTGWVGTFCMPGNGSLLYSGAGDGTIRVWKVATKEAEGECTGILKLHTDYVAQVHLSPDETTLYSCSGDQTVATWALPEGQVITHLRGHTSAVTSLALVPGSDDIFSASQDRSVIKWPKAHLQTADEVKPRGDAGNVRSKRPTGKPGPGRVVPASKAPQNASCRRCPELREMVIYNKTLVTELRKELQNAKGEAVEAGSNARQMSEHMALRADARDKAWTTIQVRLAQSENDKRDLELQRAGLRRENEMKQYLMDQQETKMRADIDAMRKERDDALETASQAEATLAEEKEKWRDAEEELKATVAELKQTLEEEREAYCVERSGSAIKTKNFESLSVQLTEQLKKERVEGRTETAERCARLEKKLSKYDLDMQSLRKEKEEAVKLQFSAEEKLAEVSAKLLEQQQSSTHELYLAKIDMGPLKQKLAEAYAELEQYRLEDEDFDGRIVPAPTAAPVSEGQPSPEPVVPRKKGESRLSMQKRLVRAVSDTALAQKTLESERKSHAVALKKVHDQHQAALRSLASYKERMGPPREETGVPNIASVGECLSGGVAAMLAHKSMLDKFAENLRPAIAANRPQTAMVSKRRTLQAAPKPWAGNKRPTTANTATKTRERVFDTRAPPITLSGRPQSAMVLNGELPRSHLK